MYICPKVTNCPLFYSDEEEIVEIAPPPPDEMPEVVEISPPPPDEMQEVVEIAPPLPNAREKGGGGILPGSK